MRATLAGLAKEGVDITVVCPETDGSDVLSADRIQVLPFLKERSRKALKLHERAQNLHHIAAAAENADVIWTLDASFPLRVRQPIVLTLQTIAYEEELNSFWDFNWDVLVVASQYLGSVVEAVAGPAFWSGTPPAVKVILNGIDTDSFVPTDPARLLDRLGLPVGKYILFPHRPEPAKGFDTALLTLGQLVGAGFDYKLLIPTNPSSVKSCLDKERRYYGRLSRKVEQLGLASSVIFHPWVSLEDLPSYYSLGESCLMLSALPEGFGFTTVQSISCGTPVVSTKAGSLRERLPPNHGVTYVEIGAVESAVSAILEAPKRTEVSRGQEYVRAHYSLDRYVREYLDCFEKAGKNTGRYTPTSAGTLRLSPWCYSIDLSTVWHDLEMRRVGLTRREVIVLRQIMEGPEPVNFEEYTNEVAKLLKRGIITLSPTLR
jgi:glycosyltransferase involved in cell wall biosynthesis